MCDKKKLKIKFKLTKMECANKTGLTIGPNLLSSNINARDDKTNKKMKLEEGIIEIKKEHFYE